MTRKFDAKLLLLDPDDLPRATEVLAAFDCAIEIDPSVVDPDSEAIFGFISGTTELDVYAIGDWFDKTVAPLLGLSIDVDEWSFHGREPW